ncbi:MAG: translesion error-prone DNA polymerase V autoproteolytic subunit [Candidatus Campbellbacteria bacterium]|nr:translesion error-prone DNA polymerase V autoproteolytic subunit [Candidatus Campbellbacteria bacterium]
MKERVKMIAKSEEDLSSVSAPLFTDRPQAGFPSPADDSVERSLDLNNYIIKNPATTFFVRAEGDSMKEAGIFSGDILVVDRSLEPKPGNIVIAAVFDELTIKRLEKKGGDYFLVAENSEYEPIKLTEEMESTVWGVVTNSVRSF